jgi:hypothetical protein
MIQKTIIFVIIATAVATSTYAAFDLDAPLSELLYNKPTNINNIVDHLTNREISKPENSSHISRSSIETLNMPDEPANQSFDIASTSNNDNKSNRLNLSVMSNFFDKPTQNNRKNQTPKHNIGRSLNLKQNNLNQSHSSDNFTHTKPNPKYLSRKHTWKSFGNEEKLVEEYIKARQGKGATLDQSNKLLKIITPMKSSKSANSISSLYEHFHKSSKKLPAMQTQYEQILLDLKWRIDFKEKSQFSS